MAVVILFGLSQQGWAQQAEVKEDLSKKESVEKIDKDKIEKKDKKKMAAKDSKMDKAASMDKKEEAKAVEPAVSNK